MALVTFMSDFGSEDHYVATVKAAILRENPNITIIDISHEINASDLGHASYVLKNIFREFPEGTIHLCAIDLNQRERSGPIVVSLEGHYFVGLDCGLFSLISKERPAKIIAVDSGENSSFIAKDILGPIVAKLYKGESMDKLGKPLNQIKTLYARQVKATKREITGNVIRVDRYGNLITNVEQKEFETILKINGQKGFEVLFGRERSRSIHKGYHEVESGEYFVLFNSNGLLQIGINNGNASELLGLYLDAPVIINFET